MSENEKFNEHVERLQAPHPLYYDFVVKAITTNIMRGYGFYHQGGESLEDIEGPIILSAAHYSNLDTLAVATAVHQATDGEQVHFLAKKQLQAPVIGKLAAWGGAIFLDRSKSMIPRETRDEIDTRLKENAILGIFPRGSRDKDTPQPQPITADSIDGVHGLAAKSGATVVPVGIAGTRKGDRGPIVVSFGEPLLTYTKNRKWTTVAREFRPVIARGMRLAQEEAEQLRAHL